MAINDPDHPEFARERQDVDVPHVALAAEQNYPIGRGPSHSLLTCPSFVAMLTYWDLGGAGNIHHLTAEERAEAKEHNKHVRANSSGSGSSKERANLRGLAEKGKDKIFGRKDSPS